MADVFVVPMARLMAKTGVPPNVITVLGLAASILVAYGFFIKELSLVLLFLVLTGLFDVLDGAVARELDSVTDFGGFFDSVLDRYADGAVLLGVGLYLGGHYPLVIVTLIGFFMVSYTRARAENVMDRKCDVGLAERAERLIIIMVAVVVEMLDILDPGKALVYGLVILAVVSHFTALQRISYTLKVLRQ